MKEITLKFGGSIYMENYGEQEEEDRIKVFDSDKEYLDYFVVEPLEKARSIYKGLSIQEDLLDVYADQMAEKESIEALLDYLGINWLGIFPNEVALYRATGLGKNEWCNHIGKYFVEIEEH